MGVDVPGEILGSEGSVLIPGAHKSFITLLCHEGVEEFLNRIF